MGFALHTWVLPFLMRKYEEFERNKAELAQRLGREPTNDELAQLYRRPRKPS